MADKRFNFEDNKLTFNMKYYSVIFHSIIYVVTIIFLIIAIKNLIQVPDIPSIQFFASIFWILFFFSHFFLKLSENNFSNISTDLLSLVVRNRFVLIENHNDEIVISVGFYLGNKRRILNQFNSKSIVQIHWGMGQASGITQKDKSDALMFIKFDKNAKHFCTNNNDSGLCAIELELNETDAREFNDEFINFLINNGVILNLPSKELIGQRAKVNEITGFGFTGKIDIDEEEYSVTSLNRCLKQNDDIVVKEFRGNLIYVEKETPCTDAWVKDEKNPDNL